jgi:hypothetical protein
MARRIAVTVLPALLRCNPALLFGAGILASSLDLCQLKAAA